MKLSELKTNDEKILQEELHDPEFRAEWERTALARAVALAVVRTAEITGSLSAIWLSASA